MFRITKNNCSFVLLLAEFPEAAADRRDGNTNEIELFAIAIGFLFESFADEI